MYICTYIYIYNYIHINENALTRYDQGIISNPINLHLRPLIVSNDLSSQPPYVCCCSSHHCARLNLYYKPQL